MLISMPTGTSTIFGVFQVMRFSQLAKSYGCYSCGYYIDTLLNGRADAPVAQVAG
jgi:hypothetical protein